MGSALRANVRVRARPHLPAAAGTRAQVPQLAWNRSRPGPREFQTFPRSESPLACLAGSAADREGCSARESRARNKPLLRLDPNTCIQREAPRNRAPQLLFYRPMARRRSSTVQFGARVPVGPKGRSVQRRQRGESWILDRSVLLGPCAGLGLAQRRSRVQNQSGFEGLPWILSASVFSGETRMFTLSPY